MYWCVGCYIDRVGNFALQQIAYAGRMSQYSEFASMFQRGGYTLYGFIDYCISSSDQYNSLLYSYNFNPIKNTHLRHVTVHYSSVLYNRKLYFFCIGRPDKSVFFSYCTLCKGSNSLIFVVCFLELV
jgi:hypothetical protein